MGLLESSDVKNGILTVVFASVFLASFGWFSHDASADGTITLENVQSTSGTTTSNQITLPGFSAGTGSNQLLVVGVSANNNNAISVTFNGTPLTKAVSSFYNNDAELWYLRNQSGTGNIVVTMSGSTQAVVGAYSFSGVNQTSPISTTAKIHNTAPGSPAISITTKYANDWALDLPSIWGGETLGSPTCTQHWDLSVPNQITGASSSTIMPSPATVTCSWTASNGDLWDDVAIEMKAAIITQPPATVPSAPTGLAATAASSSQINLAWTTSNNGGASITGYKIQRSTDSGNTWSTIAPNTGSVSTTYADTGLLPITTYTYQVLAINSAGTSTPSNHASATTFAVLPSQPIDLKARIASTSQVYLSWSAPSSNGGSPITAYNIERLIDGRWTPVAITGPTQLSYSDIGLSPATEYLYQVTASNAAGTSPPSNTASAFTQSYMIFGYSNSTGTFLSTITNGSIGMSPAYNNDYYEGEKRILPVGDALFAFYYSPANNDTMYQTSTDGGNAWSPAVSAGTGQISSDAQRFGVLATRIIDGSDHVDLLYYTSSGTTSTFYAKRGDVTGTNIVWNTPAALFSVTNFPACGVGDCAGAVGSTDTAGNVFAAFRWPATNYGSQTTSYHYEIFESSDGGLAWNLSLPDTDTGDGYRNTMALAGLGGGKMLFVDSLYSGTELYYRIFNGTSWGPTSTTSGSGLSVGIKQISSASDSRQDGLVAFTSGGNPGALRVATWNGTTGLFQAFETADNTLLHSLPSLDIVSNTVHIYSISGGKIYDTVKDNSAWQLPATPFGTSITSPVQLTSSVSYPAAVWLSSTPSWATVPSQPTGLAAKAVSTSEIDLSWTAPSSNGGSPITVYYVQRSSNGSPWTTIATTGQSQLTYSDTGLLPYSMYSYHVIASSAMGTSPPSNAASAATPSNMVFGSAISGGSVHATITNGNNALSPTSPDYYEGEKRILPVGDALFAFYYSLANNDTMYQTSTDGGNTWDTAVSANTGQISSDDNRFGAMTTTTSDGVNHIVLLYYTSSGTTSTFFAKRGDVAGTSITWDSPAALFSVANLPGCMANYGGGDCAAAVGATDTSGNVFAAFRWVAAHYYYRHPTASYHYEILESSDAGLTWKVSLPDTDTGDGYRNAMTLAGLGNGKMLFVNTPYSSTELNYKIFNGTSWSSTYATSGSGLSGGIKQISSASDSAHDALVAFVSGGHYGALRVATWNGTTGSFQSFETADGTLSHALPSITVVSNTVHIYSISGGKVYDTAKENGAWQPPANPFGTNFAYPDALTSAVSYPAAIWLTG